MKLRQFSSGLFVGSARFCRFAGVALALVAASGLRAQTTAITNLGQTPAPGSFSVGKQTSPGPFNFSMAFSFTTGATATNFSSLILSVENVLTSAAVFSVSLYSGINGSGPQGLVTSLNGPALPTVGDNSYVPSTPTTLLASTTYWWVATAPAMPNDESVLIHGTTSFSEDAGGLAGWSIGDNFYSTNNGGTSWTTFSSQTGQFAVVVTAIPEPSFGAPLAGLIALGVALRLRGRSPTRPAAAR